MKVRSRKQAPIEELIMKFRYGKQPPTKEVSSQDSRGRKRKRTSAKLSAFKQFDVISTVPSDHHYLQKSKSKQSQNPTTNNKLQKAIMKEWKILESNLPESIFVRVYEENTNLLRAVIIGPSGTPYHDGLFFFDLYFPSQYPDLPPEVYYHSHGLRLNPNLYANGYVCLSILNTWVGKTMERWNPNNSTILQVLVSIQGLVLNSEPFFNEPLHGFLGSFIFASASKYYTNNAFVLSCKTMVYLLKNPPKSFEGFVVDHFLDRGISILSACKAYINGEVAVGRYGMDAQGISKSSCSITSGFKNSLNGVVSQLIEEFAKIGVDNSGLGIVEGIKKNIRQWLTKLIHGRSVS